MGNHLGARLSRLVRERAYVSGGLPEMERREASLMTDIKAVRREVREINKRIAELDEGIAHLSAIDTSQIRPIRPTPRRLGTKHGTFNAALVTLLRKAN